MHLSSGRAVIVKKHLKTDNRLKEIMEGKAFSISGVDYIKKEVYLYGTVFPFKYDELEYRGFKIGDLVKYENVICIIEAIDRKDFNDNPNMGSIPFYKLSKIDDWICSSKFTLYRTIEEELERNLNKCYEQRVQWAIIENYVCISKDDVKSLCVENCKTLKDEKSVVFICKSCIEDKEFKDKICKV